jgi:hypothetical protein
MSPFPSPDSKVSRFSEAGRNSGLLGKLVFNETKMSKVLGKGKLVNIIFKDSIT